MSLVSIVVCHFFGLFCNLFKIKYYIDEYNILYSAHNCYQHFKMASVCFLAVVMVVSIRPLLQFRFKTRYYKKAREKEMQSMQNKILCTINGLRYKLVNSDFMMKK
jgi:hypothetical protein